MDVTRGDGANKLARYQMQGVLGEGGAATVVAAWDSQLRRTVAIKKLKAEGVDGNQWDTVVREAMHLASIRHANIVGVYDMGVADGTPFIVMEHVAGETIEQRAARGPMPLEEFHEFARQTLEGVVAAHHAGLLHRDLKPSNLMIALQPSGSLQVKILDFGIGKAMSAPSKQTVNLDGTITGSLHCIAPEQLTGGSVDARTDLYSLGCVFYFALSGVWPFPGEDAPTIMAGHLSATAQPLSKVRPDVPAWLAEWVMDFLPREPLSRHQSAAAALTALQSGAAAAAVRPAASAAHSRPAMPPIRAKESATGGKRKAFSPLALVGAAVLALGALALGAGVLGGRNRDSQPVAATPLPETNQTAASMTPAVAAAPAPAASAVPVSIGATQRSASGTAAPIVVGNKEGTAPVAALTPAAAAVGVATTVATVAAAPAPVVPRSAAPRIQAAPPVPVAPPKPKTVLRAKGSNTVGGKLLPELVKALMTREGYVELKVVPGAKDEFSIQGRTRDTGEVIAVDVKAFGTKTAFEGLSRDECEVGMASRPVTDEEQRACEQAGLGDLRSPACEHVLALDGLAIVVHPSSKVTGLTREQARQIFTGKIKDWAEVGGEAGPITLHARDDKSGTFDTFKSLVLGTDPLATGVKRYEDTRELAAAVGADPKAIGFVGLAYVGSTRAVAVSEPGTAAFLPTRFTVATEDYLLSRRLFLYTTTSSTNPWVRKLVEYALSDEGQQVVQQTGFVKQSIDLERPITAAGVPADYLSAVKEAERLSLSFRFRKGSRELDNRGLRDLDRITEWLGRPEFRGKQLILMGFADNSGSASTNVLLSRERADVIRKALIERGISVGQVIGLGSALPVASNDNEIGREKNRRVEVWLRGS